jgi:hypothetical protein
MTALELMDRLGGEIVMNRVRVVVDGKTVVAAVLNGSEWEPTEEGTALMNLHSNLAVEEAKPTKTRKSKAAQVESGAQPEQEQQAETVEAVEVDTAESVETPAETEQPAAE